MLLIIGTGFYNPINDRFEQYNVLAPHNPFNFTRMGSTIHFPLSFPKV